MSDPKWWYRTTSGAFLYFDLRRAEYIEHAVDDTETVTLCARGPNACRACNVVHLSVDFMAYLGAFRPSAALRMTRVPLSLLQRAATPPAAAAAAAAEESACPCMDHNGVRCSLPAGHLDRCHCPWHISSRPCR